MTPEAARSTLDSLSDILARVQDGVLTAEEMEEFHGHCRLLQEGIACRPIYNRLVRDVCALLTSPELLDGAAGADKALAEVKALRTLTG